MNNDYLPHRRQRPLADTSHEYRVLHGSSVPTFQHQVSSLSKSSRLMAIAMGIIAGLSTVGTGAIVMPLKAPNNPQVAGIQTTQAYVAPEPVATPLPKTPVCWNQVKVVEGSLAWQDSCRGLPPVEYRSCLDRTFELTEKEEVAYRNWYADGKVLDPACQASPEEIPDDLPSRDPF